jgi:hypothetical protein
MKLHWGGLLLPCLVASLLACGQGDDPCASSDGPCFTCSPDRKTFDDEVRPHVERYCGNCHGASPSFGAPVSLLSFDDIVNDRPGGRVLDHIVDRLSDATMPPANMPRPPEDVVTAILSWASCGQRTAVVGDGLTVSASPYLSPEQAPEGLDPVELRANAFAVGVNDVDRYRCFVFEAPVTEDRFIRRFEPVIDDERVVHHIVLLRDADGTAPPSDYDCLTGMPTGSEYLYAWAPGQGAFEFPEGGLRTAPGERFVLQIHYNNGAHLDGVKDSSGVRLLAGPPTGTEYGQVAVGPIDFVLPPHAKTDVTSKCDVLHGTKVLAGMPHMHVLGSSFHQRIVRASDQSEVFIDLTGWRFDTQLYYSLPFTLNPGDRLETTCTFDNTSAEVVQAGPNTADEMCFNFMYVTPPPSRRYCDDRDATKPTDVAYAPGACAPPSAPPSAPLVEGTWIEGAGPELSGGTIPDGQWVLTSTTFYVSEASTPVGEIDLDQTFHLARGRAFTGAGRLTLDYAANVYLKAVEGPVFGGPFETSLSGPFTASGATLAWTPDCPSGSASADVDYQVVGDQLVIGFTTNDIPGALLRQRFVFQREP